MTAALGIDCGGSATRWLLLGDDGRLVARGEAPGATGHVFIPEARDHTRAVLSGICAEVIAQPVNPKTATAGVTGLTNVSAEAGIIRDWLAADLAIAPDATAVVDDMWIAFHTVFEPGTGIVIYAGTGAVATHIDAAGDIKKAGAHGHIIDDGGAAYWIGQQAIRWLVRTWDEQGAAPTSSLAKALYRELGGPDWELIRQFVYSDPRGQVAKLARPTAAAANDGDTTALRILEAAGAELARLTNVLARHVGPQPVALTGGTLQLHPAVGLSVVKHLDRNRIALTEKGDPDMREAHRTPVEAAAQLALARIHTR